MIAKVLVESPDVASAKIRIARTTAAAKAYSIAVVAIGDVEWRAPAPLKESRVREWIKVWVVQMAWIRFVFAQIAMAMANFSFRGNHKLVTASPAVIQVQRFFVTTQVL